MKNLVLALMLAVPFGFSMGADSADAKPRVNLEIYFGDHSYFPDRPGDGYLFRRGYGWYLPHERFDRRYRGNWRYSCGQARRIIRDRGYDILATRDCQGSQYSFRVERGGRVYTLIFNSRSGALRRA